MSENIEKCISQFPKSNRDLFCLTKLIKQHILTFEKLKPEDIYIYIFNVFYPKKLWTNLFLPRFYQAFYGFKQVTFWPQVSHIENDSSLQGNSLFANELLVKRTRLMYVPLLNININATLPVRIL